jgi:general secretion pathway protein I
VLIALAIIAVSLTAIGSLMAASVRGTRSIDEHLALVETARAIEAGLPDRADLKLGSFGGIRGPYRWRVDVLPYHPRFIDTTSPSPWLPQAVVITVQSPDGPVLRLNSVRLARRAAP